MFGSSLQVGTAFSPLAWLEVTGRELMRIGHLENLAIDKKATPESILKRPSITKIDLFPGRFIGSAGTRTTE